MRKTLAVLAGLLFASPALGADNLPLVIVGGQVKQIPAANNLKVPSISGSTQCLHASTAGVITGTGADCGTGSGSVGTSGSPANGNLTKFTGASTISNGDLSGDCTTSGTLAVTCSANSKIRGFGTTFGDTAGSALTAGPVVYFTIPYACTVAAWNITVDAGTVTFDIWKIASGTAIPTVANTITAAAKPALSTGTALHSTSMSGWTTSVTANDIFGIKLDTVATAKYAEIDIQCNS